MSRRKAKGKAKPSEAWRKWYDPSVTDEQYERWREEHRERALKRAFEFMDELFRASPNMPPTAIAARAGVSPSTVRRYMAGKRKGRGPLLTTWLLMRTRIQTGNRR